MYWLADHIEKSKASKALSRKQSWVQIPTAEQIFHQKGIKESKGTILVRETS